MVYFMIKTPKRHHHFNRIVNKRKNDIYSSLVNNVNYEHVLTKTFKMRLHTPKFCSCCLCGNPRKFYGNGKDAKTLQELKAINDEIYQKSIVNPLRNSYERFIIAHFVK